MKSSFSISLCMITKNEEHCIASCLSSAQPLVDEMIVVDTGSTDNTISIATTFGARVYPFCWMDDFSAARNYGLRQAHGHWILILDADEFLAPISREELIGFMNASPAEGYYFRISSYLDDHHKNVEDYVVRLFKNSPEYRFIGAIHEQIAGSIQSHHPNTSLVCAPFTIEHVGYLQKEIQGKGKFDRNTSLLKKSLRQNPQDPFLHYCLGIEYLQHKKFPQAMLFLQDTLTLLHGNEGYLPQVLIGLLLVKLAAPEDPYTEEFFHKTIQTLPDHGDVFCLYGLWLMQHNRFLEAAQILEKGMCKNNDLVQGNQFLSLLGDAYFFADLPSQAMECYINSLCTPPINIYILMRLLTLWPKDSASPLATSLWERITPEIITTLWQQAQSVNRVELSLATLLFAMIQSAKVKDTSSLLTSCNTYVQIISTLSPTTSLPPPAVTLLSLGAEELFLQSQLLPISVLPLHNIQQAIINIAQRHLIFISSIVKELSPADLLKSWEEVLFGEKSFDCQPDSAKR